MKKMLLLLLVVFYSQVFAQNTGVIKGKVVDSSTGEVLIGANVVIEGTKFGAATDITGEYIISNVPKGTYTVAASFMGYQKIKITNVNVTAGNTVVINFKLPSEDVTVAAIEITATRPLVQKSNVCAVRVISVPDLSGNSYAPEYNTEEYSKINENDFFDVIKKPLSTFAADVDAASYSNVRRFLMEDQLPYKDAVRVEEFINYFDYDYEAPKNKIPLAVSLEYSDCPWNSKNKLVHIGIKGEELTRENKKASNIVFLLDVSGSMSADNKLPLVIKSFKLLTDQLTENDKVSIVVYAGAAGLVLPPTSGGNKGAIIRALEKLEAGGSTAGGQGILLAYKIAKENFIKEGNNRVVLATDGDFNVGISSTSEMTRLIEEKRKDGIFLTVLGFGMGNYKDDRLQELADRGNGNHAYIDDIMEAKKVLVNEINATLYTIAKDVKIQVEFNPAKVKSYRLVGYENRLLNDKDFTDDTKDAGEIGSGHTVTALYEIVPANDDYKNNYDLKYQETKIKDNASFTDEVLTVRIRYKAPEGDTSKEITSILKDKEVKIDKSSDNFRFSSAVAMFGMLLRDSEFKADANFSTTMKLAKSTVGKDNYGYRAEFIKLVERAEVLKKLEESNEETLGEK